MIDELPTRAALSMAAVLLLATGLSVLSVFDGDAAREAAKDLAAHLERQLDLVGSLEGNGTFRGGVGASGAFDLPPNLAGSPYTVEFRSTNVRVILRTSAAVVALRTSIHPFLPDRGTYSGTDLGTRDWSVVHVRVGTSFIVARTQRIVDGAPAYLTFVYLP